MNERADSCGIYLVLPGDEAPALRNSLEEILQGGRIACVLLESGAQGGGDPALARELCALTQAHDVAFLVQDDLAAVTAAGADGIHVTGGEVAYAQARRQLGEEAIVGVACATQRHTALVVAEQGADYVAFTRPTRPEGAQADDEAWRDVIAWWSEIVEVPQVAFGAASLAEAGEIAALGADFVAVREVIWQHEDGPVEAVSALADILARNSARSAA